MSSITSTQLTNISGLTRPDNYTYPVRETTPVSPEEQNEPSSAQGTFIYSADAEEAAENLSYDQPSAKQSRAIYAYQDVAMQERRSQIQQMVSVDLYA